MKNGETRGRQFDIVVLGAVRNLLKQTLIFEISGSQLPKVAMFVDFEKGFQLQSSTKNSRYIILQQFSMIIN